MPSYSDVTHLTKAQTLRRGRKCISRGYKATVLPFGKLPGYCVSRRAKHRKGRYSRCRTAQIFLQRPNRPGLLLLADKKRRLRSCGSSYVK